MAPEPLGGSMSILWLDIETRSKCDLLKRGVYNYAEHPSTEVLCICYALDDGEIQTWRRGEPLPLELVRHKGQVRAHNAAFEWLLLFNVLGLEFKPTQWFCTATQARANCLPGSLEDVGRALGASMRKDHRGSQLIRALCIPQADGTFNEDPALMEELEQYCAQDVRAMRAISKAMRELTADERRDWYVNECINERGILVDVELCKAAMSYATDEADDITRIVREVTGGALTSVRSPKMREWVHERVGPQAKKMMIQHKDGEAKVSIDKATRANLLILAEENSDEVPPDVADVIQCADDIWASSVAKFARLKELACHDDRVRGAFVFAGGVATGRASSYGAQVHNFTRRCVKEPQRVRDAMVGGLDIVPHYGRRVTDVLKGMLRPSIYAKPGYALVVADWAAIEARANPWLSNDLHAEEVLDVFRAGRDIYVREAAGIFRSDEGSITPDQRQIGKVAILSCFGPYTQVLTNNGYKAIVAVSKTDLLWDGEEWVSHQGLIFQGQKKTINLLGVEVTPEHLIKTGEIWLQAQQLDTSESMRSLALETGSANLPLWALKGTEKAPATLTSLEFNVRVGLRRIWCMNTTCVKDVVRDAIHALKKLPVIGERNILVTPQFALTMQIDGGCWGAYPHVLTDAITRMTKAISIMAAEVLRFTTSGAKVRQNFLTTSLRWKVGISHNLNLTVLTLTKAMSQAILGSLRALKTWLTDDKYRPCNNTSKNLKPVYDILNSGPRNRFTIKTNRGHLIVHNCGYAGGVGAFAAMGRAYGVVLPEEDAKRTVNAWRRANSWAVRYWSALENAYLLAMRHKGREFTAGRVTYLFDGVHLWYALPSGRVLCYPFARLEEDGVSYLKAAWKPAADAKEWPRARLWRGLACENVCQATANDLLRHSLRQCPDAVLHVHDEIVLEVPEASAEAAAAELVRVMCTPPAWAAGLPLKTEVKVMTRYGK